MRYATLAGLFLLVACRPNDTPPERQQNEMGDPVNRVSSANASSEAGETQAIPAVPPEDALGSNLSPSQRRDFDAGYGDCRQGQFRYDDTRHGEYYRIGCMAAENLGSDPK